MSRNAKDCENSGSLPQLESEPEVEQIGEAPEEVPFEIPNKWKWVRLSSVQFLIRGITFPASAKHKEPKVGLIRCLTTGSVQQTHRPVSDVYVKSEYVKNNKQYLRRGDVVLSSANSRELVGKNIIWSCDASNVSFGGFLTVARSRTDVLASEFAYVVYQYLFVSGKFMEIATQTTNIANISNKVLAEIALPVPPLAEQRRIVARLNELLPLVDEFGEAQKAFTIAQTEFPGKLKASLLQAAIEGKLVPQLESEPEVKQIGEAPEEVPFEIPKKWKWVAIGAVCVYIQRGKSPKYSEIQQIPVVAQKCNQWDGFHIEKAKFIVPETASSYNTERWLQDKDVLWNSTGLGTLGRVALYKKQLNPYGCAVADSHVTVMRCSSSLLPEYLYCYICSPSVQSVVEEISDGSTKQKELATKTIREFQLPLPPLAEQHRIVARVNELLSLLDELH